MTFRVSGPNGLKFLLHAFAVVFSGSLSWGAGANGFRVNVLCHC